MSKHMQLTVRVRAHYAKDLKSAFPRLARRLVRLEPEWAGENPSFYDLAGRIDKLLYASEGTVLRSLLLRHDMELRRLHREIEALIADWRLSEADGLLYKLEDIFEQIEEDLASE